MTKFYKWLEKANLGIIFSIFGILIFVFGLTYYIVNNGKFSNSNASTPYPEHITLTLTNLLFTSSTKSHAPPSQALGVAPKTGLKISWTATTDKSWCHVTPTSRTNSTGEVLKVYVDSLTTNGKFICNITITDPKADNSPQKIIVTYYSNS